MTGSAAPVVTVIIPTLNRAAMIGAAIDSVRSQSFVSWEVVVVDDGSTDDTEQVVGADGEKVRYVRTDHGGVAHARNVGMRHARGRYLTFLDSDDLLYPYALELQVSLLERFPEAGLVCAEMSGFDDQGFFERYHLKTYHRSAYRDPAVTYQRVFASSLPLVVAVAVPPLLHADDATVPARRVYLGNVFDTYLLKLVLCQNSVMLRREVAEAAGERNVRVRHWQEVDYLLTITRHHTVCFADVPTYKLRYHEGQVSTTAGPDGTLVWMRKQQILLRVVRRHALADRAYYQQHRDQIDHYLAHLHRAVAVPMLLCRDSSRRCLRHARRHLRRAASYGHPAPALQLAWRLPEPIRRLVVSGVETLRHLGWRVRHLVQPATPISS